MPDDVARSLDQILQELNASYDPSRQLINDQIASLPGQADAQIAGLNAQKDSAFNDITNGARDRGMGFSGIPLADQAKYVSTDFLPAVAKVQQAQIDTKNTLLGALNSTNQDQMKFGQSLYQNDLNLDEQKRQFDAQQAAARASAAASNASLSSLLGGGAGQGAPTGPQMAKKANGGGFAFADASGNPISAARYAQLSGKDIRDVLYTMGQQGDTYSQQVYNQIVKDPFFMQNLGAYAKTYSPLFWDMQGGPVMSTASNLPLTKSPAVASAPLAHAGLNPALSGSTLFPVKNGVTAPLYR